MSLMQARGEVNMDAYLALFSELVSYCRDRVQSVVTLQDKLSELGYRIGRRALDLLVVREKITRREIRLRNILSFICLNLWTFLFGKPAGSLMKVRDSELNCKCIFLDHIHVAKAIGKWGSLSEARTNLYILSTPFLRLY